jgi:transposase-like protein
MLTPQEVARRLEVDPETLRRWAREDKGPPYVLVAPATKRYPEKALIAWLQDNLRPRPEARAS